GGGWGGGGGRRRLGHGHPPPILLLPSAAMDAATPPVVRAPRGRELSCQGWLQEAALRMLMNNLDPEVAEDPANLVVYGGTGRAAPPGGAFDALRAPPRPPRRDRPP